ncbi:MAG: GatB/YqeY domain-containing protein [Deltaproteobacteria bacterium]|nr:GatB/YqeY domain-containing protein [Deltaproteobacteria bacterium]
MNILEQLEQDYLAAYKGKDSLRLGVLRLLKTALKNFQVEHLRPPTEEDVLAVIARQCKQRLDSTEQFRAAGRQELADKESAEYAILCSYLPKPLEGEELDRAVKEALAELKARDLKDMGRVMQHLTAVHKARLNGKAASAAVRAALQTARAPL